MAVGRSAGSLVAIIIIAYVVYQLYQSSQTFETTQADEWKENVQLTGIGFIGGVLAGIYLFARRPK